MTHLRLLFLLCSAFMLSSIISLVYIVNFVFWPKSSALYFVTKSTTLHFIAAQNECELPASMKKYPYNFTFFCTKAGLLINKMLHRFMKIILVLRNISSPEHIIVIISQINQTKSHSGPINPKIKATNITHFIKPPVRNNDISLQMTTDTRF